MSLQLPTMLKLGKPWVRPNGSLATRRCYHILKFLDAAKIGRHFIATRSSGDPAFHQRTKRILVFVENSPEEVYNRLVRQKIRCLLDKWDCVSDVRGSLVNMRVKYRRWTWEFTFSCIDWYKDVDHFDIFAMSVLAGHTTTFFQVRINVDVAIYLSMGLVKRIRVRRPREKTSLQKRSALAITEAVVQANPNSDFGFSAYGAFQAHYSLNRMLINMAKSMRCSWFIGTFSKNRTFKMYVFNPEAESAYTDIADEVPPELLRYSDDPKKAVDIGFESGLCNYMAVIPSRGGVRIIHQ